MASGFGWAPGRIDFVLYGLWLLGATALNSNVETDFGKCVLIVGSAAVPLGAWCLRGILAVALGVDPARSRREKWAWAVLPATFVLAWAIGSSDLPLRLRFLPSEPALREAALSSREGRLGRVGLFTVDVQEYDGLRHLFTCDAGFAFDRAGLVYAPDGEPVTTWPVDYEHLTGPWWTFHWHD